MTELEPSTGGRRWLPIAAGVVAAAVLVGGGFWLATRDTDDSVEGDGATTAATASDGEATTDDGDGTTDTGSTTTETEDGETETEDGDTTTTAEGTTTSAAGQLEFEGEGDDRTDTFRVREGWEIRWQSFGDHFAMTILGDQNLGTVVDVDEPTSGLTTPPPAAGQFHIEVEAEGRWTITVDPGG